jgi:hypothetical protein
MVTLQWSNVIINYLIDSERDRGKDRQKNRYTFYILIDKKTNKRADRQTDTTDRPANQLPDRKTGRQINLFFSLCKNVSTV